MTSCIFEFGTIVADLARLMTLEPGDIILTGTPTGSTVVEPGDVVEVEVTAGSRSSGRLRSPIVESAYQLPTWGAMPRTDDATDGSGPRGARASRRRATPSSSGTELPRATASTR